MKYMKKLMTITLVVIGLLTICFGNVKRVSAWIGTGSGGSGSGGGGGGSGSCSGNLWMYAVGCAGVSWAYYKANNETTQDIAFPSLQSESTNVPNVKIPAECSKNGGGFWHFGINSFGVKVSGNALVTGGYYGHWSTMNADHYTATWAPYNTADLSGKKRQSLGVYTLEKYGTVGDVLKAYQQTFKRDNPGKAVPNYIPGNVWGFCWEPSSDSDSQPEYFVGSSVVLSDNGAWNESRLENGTGLRLDPYWKPNIEGVSDYYADKTFVLRDCNVESGCDVVFRHYIKRNSGSGKTKYSVSKSVDGVSSNVVSGENDGNSKSRLVKEDILKIYPGQKICETLSFYVDGKSNRVTTTICAAATGSAGSSIDIEIRDEKSSSKYQDWGKVVYAKPGDEVEVRGTYDPIYQDYYSKRLFGRDESIGETFNNDNTIKWNNAFSLTFGDSVKNVFGEVGSVKQYSDDSVRFSIYPNDAGKAIESKAITNYNDGGSITPNSVTIDYSDVSGFTAEVNTESISSEVAITYVPYNFRNKIEKQRDDGGSKKDIVYAGEKIPIKYELKVGEKNNELTNGTYATNVPGARWGVSIRYDSGEYKSYLEGSGDLVVNESRNISGNDIIVDDVSAGTKICIRAWLWPESSGDDNSMEEEGFQGTVESEEDCFTVAKKPSLQVWGGDVYVGNGAEMLIAEKSVLQGYNSDNSKKWIFGSWGELSVVGNGIGNLASGASLGYARQDESGNLIPEFWFGNDYHGLGNNVEENIAPGGGNKKTDIGILRLNGGGSLDGEKIKNLAEELAEKMEVIDGDEAKNIDYSLLVGEGVKKFYKNADGDIIINNNIGYIGSYNTLESAPKVVVYAKNIKIACEVKNIDAILIAKEDINTCADDDEGKNKAKNSVQLYINGAVIAGGTLKLNRTYGAATGANSIIPAEIINMDPSWYLWAAGVELNNTTSTAGTKNDGLMVPTYVRELPPRY